MQISSCIGRPLWARFLPAHGQMLAIITKKQSLKINLHECIVFLLCYLSTISAGTIPATVKVLEGSSSKPAIADPDATSISSGAVVATEKKDQPEVPEVAARLSDPVPVPATLPELASEQLLPEASPITPAEALPAAVAPEVLPAGIVPAPSLPPTPVLLDSSQKPVVQPQPAQPVGRSVIYPAPLVPAAPVITAYSPIVTPLVQAVVAQNSLDAVVAAPSKTLVAAPAVYTQGVHGFYY
ncbi:hypothetical protein NQ315_007055 [Exocentrus adspersus]|uniref:Calphotin-like n=1 Tax=Exocentrus adspersus TaxID=1586481 RepID=A0AAV8WCD0_9CUCU|nr:hypothetical protein NQ315_007055 [Exocentrus adspersus]